MNSFDLTILTFVNGFARRSELLDRVVQDYSSIALTKTGPLLVIVWWVWFRESETRAEARAGVLSTLLGAVAALVSTRLLVTTLPYRVRPINSEAWDIVRPYGMAEDTWGYWSSFPSDHAALFFALATGLWLHSRRLGIVAFLYVALFIALPRLFLGLHYPTDILAGAAIAVLAVWIAHRPVVRRRVAEPLLGFSEQHPELFYPGFFLVSFQVAELFSSTRSLLKAVRNAAGFLM